MSGVRHADDRRCLSEGCVIRQRFAALALTGDAQSRISIRRFDGMGRRPNVQYLVTAHYSIGWGGNRDLLTSGFGLPDETEARCMHASGLVGEMRRGGAATARRRVRVRKWERAGSLDGAPTLLDESYYDVA